MGPTRSWLAGAWPWAAVAAVFALGWLGALLWPGWGPASRAPERALAHGLAPLRKLEIPLPNAASGLASLSGLAISPDGTKLLYIADGSVWLRWLDRTGAPVLLAGKDVSDVFWSPRSTEVGFCRDGKLWTVPVSGGDPNLMCPFPRQQATGAAWIPGDQILFCMEKSGSTGHGLYAISATGDEPRLLIPFQEATVGQGIRPLLGTGGVIFVSYDQKRRRGTVDVWTPGGKRKTLLELPYTIGACTFAPPGHVLFNRLRDFAGLTNRTLIARADSIAAPRWNSDGAELFFVPETALMSLPVGAGTAREVGRTTKVFDVPVYLQRFFEPAPSEELLLRVQDQP